MAAAHPSITEYAVLGILASGPSHGFAISKQLGPEAPLGRILTVRRPLVYRALDRMVGAGNAEPVTTEKGDAGPNRIVLRITPAGGRQLDEWLGQPVEHVRDLRIEFLLKLSLLESLGRSPVPLIRRQRATLAATLTALDETQPGDHVELWRRHNAVAAAGYLDDLESRYS
jgi:DNA-binding PadR family transcriptional regulator